jgi:hypothetical protein
MRRGGEYLKSILHVIEEVRRSTEVLLFGKFWMSRYIRTYLPPHITAFPLTFCSNGFPRCFRSSVTVNFRTRNCRRKLPKARQVTIIPTKAKEIIARVDNITIEGYRGISSKSRVSGGKLAEVGGKGAAYRFGFSRRDNIPSRVFVLTVEANYNPA